MKTGTILAVFVMLLVGAAGGETIYAPVDSGYRIEFPRDEGSHPEFRSEWWYVTGWLDMPDGESRGFQVTFFRTRPGTQESNPSKFAARQVVLAHAALSDPSRGKLLRGERAAREGFGLTYAKTGQLDVAIEDWSLRRIDVGPVETAKYRAIAVAADFSFDLQLEAASHPVLHGRAGYSQKGPDPRSASYYFSRPQLQVTGFVRTDAGDQRVRGRAWLDHEWSTTFLDPYTRGWDWIGINLDDGGALMVSRMRGLDGAQRWAFGTRQSRDGIRFLMPDEIEWLPMRRWRSPRTGIEYPVEWRVRIADETIYLRPLFEDQESDTRATTGTIYWEGAVTAFDGRDRPLGRGYLELTGYGERLIF